jgi:Raf kinase inhibitor-like YbhB/YbcL family protein
MAFTLESDAFSDGGVIPVRHTCDGADRSPRLRWSGAPPGTKSLALIMDDPDAPVGTFTHWLLHDISADATELAEGQQPSQVGATLKNDFGRPGYGGPCPPRGHGRHHYHFVLYALDVASLGHPATRGALETAMRAHTLATARVMGTYERKR